jgi:NADPH:quinone reductase-like Zn-dependent oxidoreductase
VIATTTTEDKRAALVAAGADVTINTATQNLTDAVLEATAGHGVPITLDHVGGDLFAQLPAATAIGGRIVSIGRLAGQAAELNLDTVAFRRQKLIGTTFSIRTRAELGDVVQALIPDVLPAVQDGRITPHVDSVHTATQAAAAADRLRSNSATGKIVLSFADAHTGTAPGPQSRREHVGQHRPDRVRRTRHRSLDAELR